MRLIHLVKNKTSDSILFCLLLLNVISESWFISRHIHDWANSLKAFPHIFFENTRRLLHFCDWPWILHICLVQLNLKIVFWLNLHTVEVQILPVVTLNLIILLPKRFTRQVVAHRCLANRRGYRRSKVLWRLLKSNMWGCLTLALHQVILFFNFVRRLVKKGGKVILKTTHHVFVLLLWWINWLNWSCSLQPMLH